MSHAALRSESSAPVRNAPVEAPWDVSSGPLETPDDAADAFRVFPFGIARLSGLPIDVLDAFCFSESLAQSLLIEHAVEALESHRQDLLAHLQEAVGLRSSEEAADERKALLRAARKLRRQRKLSAGQQDDLRRLGLEASLESWLRAKQDLEAARQRAEMLYDKEWTASRQALRRLAQDERLLKGLVLASPTLLKSFQGSLQKPLDAIPSNRLQRRRELGLLKYLSRAAAKTTPFSTFTTTTPVTFDGSGDDALLQLPEAAPPVSSVVLNKVIFALLHPWLESTPDLFPLFDLSLNPSLHATREGFSMLFSKDGQEQQARLGSAAALDVSARILREEGGTLPYPVFVDRLAEAFGADVDALRPRVDRMVACGFLGLNTGVSDGEHRWVAALRRRLAHSADAAVRQVYDRLGHLQQLLADYIEANASQRPEVLGRLHLQVEALWQDVGLVDADSEEAVLDAAHPGPDPQAKASGAAGALNGEPQAVTRSMVPGYVRNVRQSPFYEDACDHQPVRLHGERLQPAVDVLNVWIQRMARLSQRGAFHANMRAFYDEHFGSRGSGSHGGGFHGQVPFPIFYTAFYRAVFEPMLQAEQNRSQASFEQVHNPFGLEFMRQSMRASGELTETLRQQWAAEPGKEQLDFGRQHMDVQGLPRTFRGAPGSVSAFVQLVPAGCGLEEDGIFLEKAQTLAGMGKYFSRFLYQFDGRYSEQLRQHNGRHPGVLVAELCDDSAFSFNANLHPPLTDAEINYPARLTGLDAGRNLPLSDLMVCPDATDPHRLHLRHRTSGKDVLPVDLGFLNPTRRPPLFRVLKLFSPLFQHQLLFPWSTQANVPPPDDAVVHRPRLVFENRLVVSRRAWRVPASVLRHTLQGKTPVENLHRLDAWRREHGMPQEVYVHSHPMERDQIGPDTVGEADSTQGGRTYSHKPQYLSFASGLFAQLLHDEVRDHRGVLIFEEMLPRRDALAERSGRPHATELVLQLDRASHA